MMDPILEAFREYVSRIELHAAADPLRLQPHGPMDHRPGGSDPAYWARHLRHGPVCRWPGGARGRGRTHAPRGRAGRCSEHVRGVSAARPTSLRPYPIRGRRSPTPSTRSRRWAGSGSPARRWTGPGSTSTSGCAECPCRLIRLNVAPMSCSQAGSPCHGRHRRAASEEDGPGGLVLCPDVETNPSAVDIASRSPAGRGPLAGVRQRHGAAAGRSSASGGGGPARGDRARATEPLAPRDLLRNPAGGE